MVWVTAGGHLPYSPLLRSIFYIDEKILSQWQHELFAHWKKGELDFRALYDAIIVISTLPKNTIESMLDTLQIAGNLVLEQNHLIKQPGQLPLSWPQYTYADPITLLLKQ